jgi:hypothetical protein
MFAENVEVIANVFLSTMMQNQPWAGSVCRRLTPQMGIIPLLIALTQIRIAA